MSVDYRKRCVRRRIEKGRWDGDKGDFHIAVPEHDILCYGGTAREYNAQFFDFAEDVHDQFDHSRGRGRTSHDDGTTKHFFNPRIMTDAEALQKGRDQAEAIRALPARPHYGDLVLRDGAGSPVGAVEVQETGAGLGSGGDQGNGEIE